MKKIIKTIIFFAFIVAFLGSSILKTNAEEFCTDEFDCTQKCSIFIQYSYNDIPLDNIEFQVYHIATTDEYYNYTLTSSFQDIEVSFEDLSDNNYWLQFRDNLENYINYEALTPEMVFVTDDAGQYNLEDLDVGLYFIQAEALEANSQLTFSEPLLIQVGHYDNSDEKWVYAYTVEPKVSVMNLDTMNISVEKIWANTNSDLLIPEEIEIEIHCNGELFDIITLSKSNGWLYTLYDIDPTMNWGVNEISKIEDFEVSYDIDIFGFTITNTYIGTPDEELPQTGSNVYQVSIFSGIGLILLLLGVLMRYRYRTKKYED